nr:PE family protein [Mycobacterium tuberculosis]
MHCAQQIRAGYGDFDLESETVAAAASDVARIGSSIGAANAAAAGSTTSVLAAGADEVSAAIATPLLIGRQSRR